jgi:SpoVK/Ycf46/Vps4 family AAA+-type ATPase
LILGKSFLEELGFSQPKTPLNKSVRSGSEYSLSKCKGEQYRAIYQKVFNIINLQFGNPRVKGIRGFIFYGDPGTGKTFMAKILARELSLPLFFVDSSTIARKNYGESETQIARLFEEARRNRCILLFDDVESLFLERGKEKTESWNMDLNNVMFHQLDEVDTSRCAVILTTNLIGFLDGALKDRLYPIHFPTPDIVTLIEIAREKCQDVGINSEGVEAAIRTATDDFRSIRGVEKAVLNEYVAQLGIRASNLVEASKPSSL